MFCSCYLEERNILRPELHSERSVNHIGSSLKQVSVLLTRILVALLSSFFPLHNFRGGSFADYWSSACQIYESDTGTRIMLRTWFVAASTVTTVCLLLVVVSRQTNYGYLRLYTSITTKRDDHSELVNVLTEFLGLLDALVVIETESLLYPEPDTGVHAPGTINATAARMAGYSAQATTLFSSLPYLQNSYFEVGPSTHMVAYAKQDEGRFEEERIMYVSSGEEYMAPSAVQLTSGESIYGLWRIYDTDQSEAPLYYRNGVKHAY